MKKLLLCALTCILVACCSLMVACDSSSYAGTYKFESASINGVTVEAGADIGGMQFDEDFCVLKLKKDGDFTLKTNAGGETLTQEGTWEKEDDKIILTLDGEDIEVEVDDDKLILEIPFEGMNMKLTLVKD